MYNEIIDGIKMQVSNEELELIKTSSLHLGVFSEPCLTYMLDGKKTIESRFSKKKILPYGSITKDDIVFVKKSGGGVLAYFKIKDVKFFDLDNYDIEKIKHDYNEFLCVDDNFWQEKRASKYATLILISELVKIKTFHVTKKGMNTWLKIKKD